MQDNIGKKRKMKRQEDAQNAFKFRTTVRYTEKQSAISLAAAEFVREQ